MNKPDYADFNERFKKILQCDEKPVRAIRLDELYREVYDYYGNNWGGLTPEIFTCFGLLLEDIWKAIEDAGGSYPGFQKEVESFLKAINEAKKYTPEKRDAALINIRKNAVACYTNDPRTKERMQGVVTLIDGLRADALPDQTGSGAAKPGEGAVKDGFKEYSWEWLFDNTTELRGKYDKFGNRFRAIVKRSTLWKNKEITIKPKSKKLLCKPTTIRKIRELLKDCHKWK